MTKPTRTVTLDKNNMILSQPTGQQLRLNTGDLVLTSDDFRLTIAGPADFETLLPRQIQLFKEWRSRFQSTLENLREQRKMRFLDN